ncbi:hypothetical protein M513_10083 [Trichuris suis]|uniref:Reverse transcriptase domain-containing protein n=1 Tax=Trichuris suis TaxID=68888 RepID=A0A085LVN9_9BILA|nr:hypothetical protein M513_10083 [Trichuris suis]
MEYRCFTCAISNVLLSHAHQPKLNLTPLEFRILNRLKMDTSITITKADKGNAVVVMDRCTYNSKTEELLSSPSYVRIPDDPTEPTRKSLQHLTACYGEQSGDQRIIAISKRLKYTSNANSPELYCLPKVHKPDIPFRPIVSRSNCTTSALSKYIASLLHPFTGKRQSHVLNSREFLNAVKTISLSPDDILVSYDVNDLFTSVPLQYTCRLIHNLLLNDDSLSERTQLSPAQIIALTEFCMKEGNHFHFQGRFFSQKQGAPMGSPLSPVLAELFMEHLEEKAFSTRAPKFPIKAFKRYVDDIFAIIRRGSEQPFLDHLNSLFADTICCTMEIERHRRLPFLDTLLIRKETNISSQVYRKPTNTDHFAHYMSNHPLGVKRGLIIGLVDRAYHLCDPQFLDRELRHIKTVLHRNGYPHRLIDSTVARRLQHLDSPSNAPRPSPDTKITIPLPFYPGVTDKVRLPIHQRNGAIYKITCKCGGTYIGETGNSL